MNIYVVDYHESCESSASFDGKRDLGNHARGMRNTQIEYIPALTSLRGVAALWVMLFHLDVLAFYRDLGGLVPRECTGLVTKGYLWVNFSLCSAVLLFVTTI